MRALAQFIMASRSRAALVACAGNLVPLLSPAAVALVALRRGLGEGSLIALWAVLPLAITFYTSEVSPMLVWASLFTVVVVMIAAGVLRASSSWQLALLALSVVSGLTALALGQVLTVDLTEMRDMLAELFAQMQRAGRNPGLEPGTPLVLGLLAWVMAVSALGSLLLGRWWQAALYNPGGLGRELRTLRLSAPVALVLMAGATACQLGPAGYAVWGNLLGLPLFMGGVALVHHLVAVSQIGSHWLAVFYVCLVLLLGPLGLLLTGVGFIDSLIDLRARLARRRENSGGPD
ncbi:MAG: hypothetical protein CMK33_01285 [Porticoccaceae bacterium]|nr:hypothetical protein [Porticoccaceae bacterium]